MVNEEREFLVIGHGVTVLQKNVMASSEAKARFLASRSEEGWEPYPNPGDFGVQVMYAEEVS